MLMTFLWRLLAFLLGLFAIVLIVTAVVDGTAAEAAPVVERPYCGYWQTAQESPDGILVLVPIVAHRTEQTAVAVWVYLAPGQPQSPLGWYRVAEVVYPGWGVWWWDHGLTKGYHGVTMEVSEAGEHVDGWERSPQCLVLVEVR